MFRVGITPDFIGADGTPLYDPETYRILDSEPNLSWEVMRERADRITPEQAATYDAIMILMPGVEAGSVAGSDRRLTHVSRFGVGYEIIDLAACTEAGVVVTITPEGVARPVATMALTFMLALGQKLLIKDRLTRTDRWAERTDHMGIGLSDRTLGCVGAGNTAQELFRLVAPFGMRLLASDPYADAEAVESAGAILVDLGTLLAESDFVSLHVPMLESTRGLIGADELSLMQPTAYLINTARGPVVDETALIAALDAGGIAGAGLDVFTNEPVEPDNPLLKMDNVVLAPHSLCWTDECWRRCAEAAFRNIVAVSRGEVPNSVVNRDVLDSPVFRDRLAAFAGQSQTA